MMAENNRLQPVSEEFFFEHWESNKVTITQEQSEIINYFKPYIETIPNLAIGEYYWQIFSNDIPTPKILVADGAVDKLTPTDALGLKNATIEEFLAFFHPDDITQTMAFVIKIFQILFSLDVGKRDEYKICVYARVRNSEGNYLWNCLQYN